MYKAPRYLPAGDRAVLIEFGNKISPDINLKVHSFDRAISELKLFSVEECVPTYRSLMVYYDPSKTGYEHLVLRLKDVERTLDAFPCRQKTREIEVPVVYGGEFGPDLNFVARRNNLEEDEVIRLHSGKTYSVYMIGFAAGFPYLGEVNDEIATPRLKVPRLLVPAGSVGIAEKQTGIYPRDLPGGWRIIGRTPLNLFAPRKSPPALIEAGDTVKFKSVDREAFESIKGRYP
ncbi:MAG: 5-oxoprolinase subunit PxpB [Candidatus Bathyarchaeota archaeon]|nr:5-oxoprolinase subunit PxpB [Candidatus Bathyarchaeota archaeon]